MYKLTFDAKAENVGIMSVVFSAPTITTENGGKLYKVEKPINCGANYQSHDWKEYSYTLGYGNYDNFADESEMYEATIMFGTLAMAGSMNIDNVKLFAIDEDGNTKDSTNLLTNGGFEFGCEIDEAVFTKAGSVIKNIDAGEIKVTTAIRNRNGGEDVTAAIVCALYNNGKLEQIFGRKEGKLTLSAEELPGDTFTATVTVPEMGEDDNYEIKVFYWDGTETMKPLKIADFLD